ncbi:MAG TPA: 30S ribosomal protein S2 [Bacteroidetes bacterium]|nr:30S ribosomal protein S2 [Bacteroidota bacterium]
MEHSVSIETLLAAGAHFGHLTRRWNPKMQKFIFGEKNGIHIIDLRKTQILLDYAKNAVLDYSSQGKIILMVGTKPQAKSVIEEAAKRAGTPFVSERWLGGMLTNFITIRKSIKRLNAIDKMETDGTFERLTKKERLMLNRERDRLRRVFGGIENMTRIPGALFITDIKKEHIAVQEAQKLGIPIIGIVDTNTDPDLVDFPIPANDDSIKTIEVISSLIADAINEGSSLSRIRIAELEGEKHAQVKINENTEETLKAKRKFRERKKSPSDESVPVEVMTNKPESSEPIVEKNDNTSEPTEKI